ncbi:MAG: CoA pyrophosphatase [Desulfohalobiaceae bacterium]|nr:CoA pyrophosphatase [Desulfohalobiaceae bacterium]
MERKDLNHLVALLPKHPGILEKERYLNAAVLIPLLETDGEFSFLFEKRAANIRQGGEISFPGGQFDPGLDTNCRAAAIRETMEEIGISRDKIHIQGRMDTFISPRGITIDSFLATLDISGLDDLTPDSAEVEDVFLLPVSWFENNPPKEYRLELEIKPKCIDENGREIELLPVQELGLPPHYAKPWPGLEHRVFVYQTNAAVIWGITASLIQAVVSLLQA